MVQFVYTVVHTTTISFDGRLQGLEMDRWGTYASIMDANVRLLELFKRTQDKLEYHVGHWDMGAKDDGRMFFRYNDFDEEKQHELTIEETVFQQAKGLYGVRQAVLDSGDAILHNEDVRREMIEALREQFFDSELLDKVLEHDDTRAQFIEETIRARRS